MNLFFKNKIALLFLAAFGLAGCQTPTTNTNVNVNLTPGGNTNINSNFSNANANLEPNSSNTSGASIEAKEPENYQATVTLKVETGGTQKNTALPPITAQVAKMGNDKRMEFSLPNGEKIIYLDQGGQQKIISQQRKQYADLDKESLGFDIRRMMTPEQMVSQVKNLKGVRRVGEEKYAGRDAVKYTYNAVSNTNSQAGNVATESVVFVDKETGLPLHSETYSQTQNGAAVNGMNSLRFVTEISNLKTDVDANLFTVPTDYKKVAPEEVRAQVESVFRIASALLQQLMGGQMNNNGSGNTASPTPAQ